MRQQVAIGAITRRRPDGLGRLLESFEKMALPEGVELLFVIVENDQSLTMKELVADFSDRLPGRVLLELEPEQGIPFARNKVLDMALAEGADFLTFVDDDEVVTQDWLTNLHAAMDARALDLAGGPVKFLAPDEAIQPMQRAVFRHTIRRARRRVETRARAVAEANDASLDVYTNNWCVRLEAARRLGVRFDESMRFTGGSDTRFCRDMRAAGARIGWVPEAEVCETVPARRLTLGYLFSRARDQASNSVLTRRRTRKSVWVKVFPRTIDAILDALTIPVRGRYAVVKTVYKLGMATGFARGAMGLKSQHYAVHREGLHAENSATR